MSEETPTLYLFAGPNGAGKTTFARAFLTELDPVPRFLNADELARGLSPLDPSSMRLKAGKLLLREINQSLIAKKTFALESTLSGNTHLSLIKRARSSGYEVDLHYLWLPDPEFAIQRIAQRVIKGGHHIPDEDIRRRFARSQNNFLQKYAEMVDSWKVWTSARGSMTLLYQSGADSLEAVERFFNQ